MLDSIEKEACDPASADVEWAADGAKMEGERAVVRKTVGSVVLLTVALVLAAGPGVAETPLSQDDVVLLLIGGASTDKMVGLIAQRGIDFQMTPALAEKFRNAGADEMVIQALEKASAKAPSGTSTSVAASVAKGEQAQPQAASALEEEIAATLARDPENYPLAATFAIVDLSGQTIDLADYKGKVILLNFWATWCPPCRYEIPKFVELQDQYRSQGLQIIGIALDDKQKDVKKFAEVYGLNYPVAMGDAGVRRAYGGVPDLPTTFLIGPDGRIYAQVEGAPADLGRFESMIKLMLADNWGKQTVAGGAPAKGTSESAAATSAPALRPRPKSSSALPDPSLDRIQEIIREFAAKERVFKEARNNYTYHQINKVSELDPDGNVVGTYQQEWDIVYDDNGRRIERVTYAPPDTLKGLLVTKEDLENMRSIQPFVLTTDELHEYDVKYLGHVKVDEITAYVFSVRPKEIKPTRLYFQGTIWVDDRDLQIVKSEGRTVPEVRTKKGQMNLFPRFTTYREQIDGKFWFPTYTLADDTLYFAMGPVRVKQIIKFTDYKQFKAATRIQVIGELSGEEAGKDAKGSAPQNK